MGSISKIKDLSGTKVGKLLLIERKREKSKTYYLCRCDCGKEKLIRSDTIGENKVNNCGCSRKPSRARDLTNKRFGMLVVLYKVGVSKTSGSMWRCQCDCGNIKDISLSNLISGASSSCGCFKKIQAQELCKNGFEAFSNKYLVENTNISALQRKIPIKSNKSGVTGVSFNSHTQMWTAYISFQKKRYHLGYFKDKIDAINARKEAEANIYGNFLYEFQKENH